MSIIAMDEIAYICIGEEVVCLDHLTDDDRIDQANIVTINEANDQSEDNMVFCDREGGHRIVIGL